MASNSSLRSFHSLTYRPINWIFAQTDVTAYLFGQWCLFFLGFRVFALFLFRTPFFRRRLVGLLLVVSRDRVLAWGALPFILLFVFRVLHLGGRYLLLVYLFQVSSGLFCFFFLLSFLSLRRWLVVGGLGCVGALTLAAILLLWLLLFFLLLFRLRPLVIGCWRFLLSWLSLLFVLLLLLNWNLRGLRYFLVLFLYLSVFLGVGLMTLISNHHK